MNSRPFSKPSVPLKPQLPLKNLLSTQQLPRIIFLFSAVMLPWISMNRFYLHRSSVKLSRLRETGAVSILTVADTSSPAGSINGPLASKNFSDISDKQFMSKCRKPIFYDFRPVRTRTWLLEYTIIKRWQSSVTPAHVGGFYPPETDPWPHVVIWNRNCS